MKYNILNLLVLTFFISLQCHAQDMSKLFNTEERLYHLSDFGFNGKVKKITNEKPPNEFSEKSSYEFNKKGLLTGYSFFKKKYDNDPYQKTRYTYDKEGNLTNITGHFNRFIRSVEYKNNKSISSIRYGKLNPQNREQITYKYDSVGNLVEIVYNSVGQATEVINYEILYNENAQVIEEKEFRTKDSVKEVRTMYKYLYDTKGEKISEIYYKALGVDKMLRISSRTNYLKDSIDNQLLEFIKYGKGNKITEVKTTNYDENNNIIKITVSGCLQKIDELTLYEYDESNNLTAYSYAVRKNKDQQYKYCESESKIQYIKDNASDTIGVLPNSEEYNYNTDEMYQYYDNKYEYEYDKKGNWIKKTHYIREINSRGYLKPVEKSIEIRKIEYY